MNPEVLKLLDELEKAYQEMDDLLSEHIAGAGEKRQPRPMTADDRERIRAASERTNKAFSNFLDHFNSLPTN